MRWGGEGIMLRAKIETGKTLETFIPPSQRTLDGVNDVDLSLCTQLIFHSQFAISVISQTV